MKNIYFDLCAIPIFLLIIWKCYFRKMSWGRADRVFLLMNFISLICAILDVSMEFIINPLPISQGAVVAATVISYGYKVLRNGSLVIYLIYIFMVTRTEYLLRPLWARILLWLPNVILLVTLLQNIFTHNVFTITAEGGYSRGPALIVLYLVAVVYGVVGIGYCIFCMRYLELVKWLALISIYILTFVAVFIQFFMPDMLVEMFSSSIGILMVLLMVMRPEDTMDAEVGIHNWNTYQTDLRNVLQTWEKSQIVAIRLTNAMEIRSYMGESQYNDYLRQIISEIQLTFKGMRNSYEIYFERPDALYLLLDNDGKDIEQQLTEMVGNVQRRVVYYSRRGVRLHPKICVINYPDDLTDMNEIINLGHKFIQMSRPEQVICQASELIKSRDYELVIHMDEILSRAITEDRLEMYYQPIYDTKTGTFNSAEALVRINDEQYGMLSPAIFIPVAESTGLILPLGSKILESVYRFIAKVDFCRLGLSYIEVNLSVSQVLQSDLPQEIAALQKKYGVDPSQVNFEITETQFNKVGDLMEQNVEELTRMGYSFSLDDYGVGYSNIQRLSRLPLRIIKIDKSLVDEMFSDDGSVIIRNTVRMMQGIHKELVIEGVEEKKGVDALSEMGCEHIQGYYYSKPLPEAEFVRFLEERNRTAG